ncbi:MAG: bifunctional (p)ppGpp synthetase/guanosine-3',5'-bis(diphosphate) 3'-pyrophosphohydrolase [Deltaproteobacteria bacterium]|nr:bifunctional (p)ppGpp synthetase/guanosine-3',5'-bis(diphosphate) 3'-pyrophosphohydrolase [Deltaproteobacteria bacterium]
MVRLDDILDKVSAYNPSADLEIIRRAYVFSAKVHEGQTRRSGEPYLSHPMEVAEILTHFKMDAPVIATGFLHDTVEDTHATIKEIKDLFGEEVSTLVDGLTKLARINFDRREDREAENFRKMILAMAKDIRVIVIKLADRLHNMRTLDAMPVEKRGSIARETLDIYAPLANRLGIGWLKTELEDLSLKYIDPEKYAWLGGLLEEKKADKEQYIKKVKDTIKGKLEEYGVEGEVSGRLKNIHSIYAKMKERDLEFDDINDILAFRIIVEDLNQCYLAMGMVHSIWKPVPGRFKDYIAIPKPNFYQAIHTTVVGPYGERMEVQIKTRDMHMVAEYGIAAHWKYKEGKPVVDKKRDSSFAWIRQLLEWQRDLKDSDEFLDTLKVDFFPEEVFLFTPEGDMKVLPVGATPVDFAYSIHTDIGHRCIGVKVNGKRGWLGERLHNGDVVEVLTDEGHAPSRDWLKFVVTSRAKARIRQWIKGEERTESLKLGRNICEEGFMRYAVDFEATLKSGEIERVAIEDFSLEGVDSLFTQIGYGKISPLGFLKKLYPKRDFDAKETKKPSRFGKVFGKFKKKSSARSATAGTGIIVRGVEERMVRFAKCCGPLPGDKIVGLITPGEGLIIHLKQCKKLFDVNRERLVDIQWEKDIITSRPVNLEVTSKDEKGVLAAMCNVIKEADANIISLKIDSAIGNKAVCRFVVEVMNITHLKKITESLESIKDVLKVKRVADSVEVVGKEKP